MAVGIGGGALRELLFAVRCSEVNRAIVLVFLLLAACATAPTVSLVLAPALSATTSSSEPSVSDASAGVPIAPTSWETPVVASATGESAPAKPPNFASWSDRAGLDALVTDCHARDLAESGDSPDPLSCRLPFEQSCTYSPCLQERQDCRAACGSTCNQCDVACGGTCDSCKRSCTDDACRRQCAVRTAACKQACLTALDRCDSGRCGIAAVKACAREESKRWRSHACSCAKISPCTGNCLQNMGDDQGKACFGRCSASFPGCNIMYCVQGMEPTNEDLP